MKCLNSCKRCKNNFKYIYECCTCNEKLCGSCIKEIYPDAKLDDIEKAKCNVLTTYCYYRCNTDKKFCNDCGEELSTIKKCKGCFISLCNQCKIINHDKNKIYTKHNYNLTLEDKYESTNYCTLSCYIIHTNFRRNNFVNCKECHSYFVNPYKYKYCVNCRIENIVEKDVQRNKKRKELQIKVKELLEEKKIVKEDLIKFCENKIKIYIDKYKNINKNNVKFEKWLKDTDSGFHSCFNLWDYSIDSYI